MIKPLFDTNILIDYLNGIAAAKKELSLYTQKSISMITWMEVMVGATEENAKLTESFLAGFRMLEINGIVAKRAVDLRKQHRIKLPDAIIWASAQIHSMLLVTRNVKDFQLTDPGIRVPY